jgi:integrase
MRNEKMIIMPKLCNCGGKLKKQWFVYYSVRDPQSGKMVRVRHYDGFTGLHETEKYEHARKLIEDYSSRLQEGWSPFKGNQQVIYKNNIDYKTVAELYDTRQASNRTLRLVLSRYLEIKSSGISRSSMQTYTSCFRIFTLYTEKLGMERTDIKSYSNSVILVFFKHLINEKKLSAKSIKKYTELLSSLFRFCIDLKYIKINPVHGIPKCNRVNDNTARPIMREDIDVFKPELKKDPQLWLAVQFMFFCGLRPNHEIREMKIGDLDLVAGFIYVNRFNAKTGKARVVTIPKQFLTFLRENIDTRKWDRNFYIFGNKGIPGPVTIGKNTLSRKFIVIRKALNMPHEYKFYSWKHTSAVEMDESLIPMKDISRHYGHSAISITDIYMRNKKPALSVAIRDNYPDL